MKKELFIHFAFLISFFIFISVFKNLFTLSSWARWLGGIIGTTLPDLDHLVYIYFIAPQELSSQRANYMLQKKEIWKTLNFLADTREERTRLIFHTAIFQIIFLVLTFFVMTSSASLLGKGIVLAFSLHLLVDEAVDYSRTKDLANWFREFPLNFNPDRKKIYWGVLFTLLLIFGFLM